jgi:hypothetical protein
MCVSIAQLGSSVFSIKEPDCSVCVSVIQLAGSVGYRQTARCDCVLL